MSTYDRIQEYYERGLKAARMGRFMAADHFLHKAVVNAYDLDGEYGNVLIAEHLARIYRDQGMVRMAQKHYRRAMKLLERQSKHDSPMHAEMARRLEEMRKANIGRYLQGVGIATLPVPPVPPVEASAPAALREIRRLTRDGVPTLEECRRAASRLNGKGSTTGRGLPWTASEIMDLCEAASG